MQSLSFVLTLPLFIMVMMMIVQVSQLMIGQIVVEYAAFAAARGGRGWIPADLVDGDGTVETWNCIGSDLGNPGYAIDENADNQMYSRCGPTPGGITYLIDRRRRQVREDPHGGGPGLRADLALARLRLHCTGPAQDTLGSLANAYTAITGGSVVDTRLKNKLAYTLFQDPADPAQDTLTVNVWFYHSNQEYPLTEPVNPERNGGLLPTLRSFSRINEVGWQDPVTVTVTYNLALLPGPGRLLARSLVSPGGGPDAVSSQITNRGGGLYVYPLTATATLGMEGEKPNYAHYRDASSNP